MRIPMQFFAIFAVFAAVVAAFGQDDAALAMFCRTHPPGLYCHPTIATKRVFCPPLSNEAPRMWTCSEGKLCRTHRKLGDGHAQCVPTDQIDLDAFCEDKFAESGSGSLVRQCNPFQIRRNQILDCELVKDECGIRVRDDFTLSDSTAGECMATVEIRVRVEDCSGLDVCRKYDQALDADTTEAKCITPTDALCLDHFWTHLAGDVINSANSGALDPARPLNIKAEQEFRFCDPTHDRKQVFCKMSCLLAHSKPTPSPSVLSSDERLAVKERLKLQFGQLYTMFYGEKESSGNNVKYGLSVTSVEMESEWCPPQDVLPEGDQIDPDMAISGPICKQFSPKLSRCMPRATVFDTEVRKESNPAVFKIGTNAGYCLKHGQPGQYCVPGTPEMGISCPEGKVIRCRRPTTNDPAVWTDVSGVTERCIQMFGPLPPVDPSNIDPFRRFPILTTQGQEVTDGYWAKCASLRQ